MNNFTCSKLFANTEFVNVFTETVRLRVIFLFNIIEGVLLMAFGKHFLCNKYVKICV